MQAAAVAVLKHVARTRFRTALVTSADSSFRQRVSEILTGLRWQVREAEGGAQAWSEAEAVLPEAVIVDSWLPDLDLGEFLAEFRGRFPQVDLVTADGSATEEGPRGPYRQELLYALRRSQDTDTAAWNTAPALNNVPLNNPALTGPVLTDPVLNGQGANFDEWIGPALNAAALNGAGLNGHVLPAPGGALPAGGLAQRLASVPALPGPSAPSSSDGMLARSLLGGSSPNSFSPPVGGPLQPPAASLPKGGFSQPLAGQPAARIVPGRLVPGAGGAEQKAAERLPELIGDASVMLEVSRRIRLVSQRMTPVLIEGPHRIGQGTGCRGAA